jgi:integrase/recombinase XerD
MVAVSKPGAITEGSASAEAAVTTDSESQAQPAGLQALAFSLPPLDQIKTLVLDGLSSPQSRRAYGRALDDFMSWYQQAPSGTLRKEPFSKALVQEYRRTLEEAGRAPSTINLRLAAIRKLAAEAADNGLLDADLAAGITRVKGVRQHGIRAGNWLTREQARELLNAPDASTLKGKRDRAILALLIGCGLRRTELVGLRVEDIAQRESRWVLVDLVGKGRRVRTVPVPAWVKQRVDEWLAAASITSGPIFKAINKGGHVWGQGNRENLVWQVVQQYAGQLGFRHLAPHDLRRTCAKLCRKAGGKLEQIQLLLGHASVQTTERYLGTQQDLVEAVNDNLGIIDGA